MKAFTSIEQSKKLAEILPLESADMCWTPFDEKWDAYLGAPNPDAIKKEIPCWSLSALLDNIPQVKLDSIEQYDKKHWRCCAYFASDWHNSDWCDNPVDACYELILKLNELNLL